MDLMLAVTVGVLFGCGVYMVVRRSLPKVVLGIALLSHAANMLILSSSGLVKGASPLVPEGETIVSGVADPLPQAFILTAIVISFGVISFLLVLFRRAYDMIGTDDLDEMRTTDE